MSLSYRLFNCARCRRQLKICSLCDHGNTYCPPHAEEGKRIRDRKSSATYQGTERGRLNHKVRQQNYLTRLEEHAKEEMSKKKMTHRGQLNARDSLAPYARAAPPQPAGREEVPHDRESENPSETLDAPEASAATGNAPATSGEVPAAPPPAQPIRCDFCGRICGDFARLGPIRRRPAPSGRRRRPRPPIYRPP